MKKFLKRSMIFICIGIVMLTSIAFAGNLVKNVSFSTFPILLDGERYSSETPILSYQDRTYIALREFSELINVGVDFNEGTIYLDTSEIGEENIRMYERLDKRYNALQEKYEKLEELYDELLDEYDELEKLYDELLDDYNGLEEKHSSITESDTAEIDIIYKTDKIDINGNSQGTVYVSKTGAKYHFLSNCNGGNFYSISFNDAVSKGYTACLRCAN